LIVRDLTVRISETTIVEGVSFDVRAGDKVGLVGLVGRNGAGKTTLFRVLGGADDPAGGTVRRPDATGYLSQDPRKDDVSDDTSCLSHVLSGRGLSAAAERLEELGAQMAADPTDRVIAAYSAAQERFEALGGYAAEADARSAEPPAQPPSDIPGVACRPATSSSICAWVSLASGCRPNRVK
jgi:ATPase subunit of ABC transporter with duplicated ATPase domains